VSGAVIKEEVGGARRGLSAAQDRMIELFEAGAAGLPKLVGPCAGRGLALCLVGNRGGSPGRRLEGSTARDPGEARNDRQSCPRGHYHGGREKIFGCNGESKSLGTRIRSGRRSRRRGRRGQQRRPRTSSQGPRKITDTFSLENLEDSGGPGFSSGPGRVGRAHHGAGRCEKTSSKRDSPGSRLPRGGKAWCAHPNPWNADTPPHGRSLDFDEVIPGSPPRIRRPPRAA